MSKEHLLIKLKDQNGFLNKLVQTGFLDDNGFLWLGTYHGITRYDGSTFKNFTNSNFNYQYDIKISKGGIDNLNNIYFLTLDNQVFRVNKDSKLELLKGYKNEDNILFTNNEYVIFKKNNPLFFDFYYKNKKNMHFICKTLNHNFYTVIGSKIYYNMDSIADLRDYYWVQKIALVDNSLIVFLNNKFLIFDQKKCTIKNHQFKDVYNLSIFIKNNHSYLHLLDSVYDIDYSNHHLKFKSLIGRKNNEAIYKLYNPKIKGYDFFISLHIDVYISKEQLFKNVTYLGKNEQYSIYRLLEFNKKLYNYLDVFHKHNHNLIPPYNNLIVQDNKGNYKYVYNNCIYYFSPHSKQILKTDTLNKCFKNENILINDFYFSIYNPLKEYLLANNKVIQSENHQYKTYFNLQNFQVNCASEFYDTNTWILGDNSGGCLIYDLVKKKTENINFFAKRNVRAIKFDPELNLYWIFTYGDGIYFLNKNRTVIPFKKDENEYNLYAHTYLKDDYHYYWIPTNNGLLRYKLSDIQLYLSNINKFKLTFSHFDIKNGISNPEFNGNHINCAIRLTSGELAFANMAGVVVVNPKDFIENYNNNNKLVIDKIMVNNTKLKLDQNNKLILKENFTNLVFELAVSRFNNNVKNPIEYRIEGLDNIWYPLEVNGLKILSLKSGDYKISFRNTNSSSINEMTIILQIKALWFKSTFAILTYILISVLFIYLFIRRIFRFKKTRILEAQKMTESELKALRSQINPHYLSNSLTSLQRLILKDNKMQALEVLSLFGKVMRNILVQSDHPFTSLKTEIKTLKEYMNLEGMLLFYNPQFELEHHLVPDTVLETIQIPSMLIQPFVENAIIHGLSKKTDDPKILTISFEFGDNLKCIIEDNGVGRLPSTQQNKRTSMGNINVENRMKLYGNLLKQNFGIQIIDLKDENLLPKGTKVILYLPFKLS